MFFLREELSINSLDLKLTSIKFKSFAIEVDKRNLKDIIRVINYGSDTNIRSLIKKVTLSLYVYRSKIKRTLSFIISNNTSYLFIHDLSKIIS
jgi:hypothetical protein